MYCFIVDALGGHKSALNQLGYEPLRFFGAVELKPPTDEAATCSSCNVGGSSDCRYIPSSCTTHALFNEGLYDLPEYVPIAFPLSGFLPFAQPYLFG